MYARHECCLDGARAEAGLLVALLACLAILLRGTLDSLDGVPGCCHRIGGLPEKVALYFCREGCSVLFCTERAVHVSVDCYDPARSGHLELKIGVKWHYIESRKCGSS